MKYRMAITYPDGTSIKGKKQHSVWFERLGFSKINFANKSVLDIATDEGWWAFNAEMKGAHYVEACDVERAELYDWGATKDNEWIDLINDTRTGKKAFDFHHKNLNSKVVYKQESIYNVKGNFDIVFAHGLLYHLRHPLLAIDKVSSVCKDIFCFETHVDLHVPDTLASTRFYRTDEYCHSNSNWTGASIGCYASWLRDAGFEYIFRSTWGPYKSDRRVFIACKTNKHIEAFKGPEMVHLDEDFFDQMYKDTSYHFKDWSAKK